MEHSHILKQYDEQKFIHDECANSIESLIKRILSNAGIRIQSIESRVKDKDSLGRKIIKKGYKYKNLSDITDIVGIRIITYFEDDVDQISQILRNDFLVDENNSADKRVFKEPDRFGYQSLHLILCLGSERSNLSEYKNFSPIRFEVQIRTVLQHAWAEIEHDLGYKSEKEVPMSIRRRFTRIAGLLELADQEFTGVVRDIQQYRESAIESVNKNDPDLAIDAESLSAFINSSSFVEKLDKVIADHYETDVSGVVDFDAVIRVYDFQGINTISRLKFITEQEADDFVDFLHIYSVYIAGRPVSKWPQGASLVMLSHYLAAKNLAKEDFIEYMDKCLGYNQDFTEYFREQYISSLELLKKSKKTPTE